MGDFFVHNIQLYDYKPVAINALAFDEDSQQLAVGFKNGAVAIYNVAQGFFQTQYVLPSVLTSVEALQWLDRRLFACGMTGYVSEVDPLMGTVKRQVPTHAMGAWCMSSSVQGARLAVGTETGAVCLFKLDEASGELEFQELLHRSPSRILAISWSSFDANLIVTAGVGFLALVDLRHGTVQKEFPTRPETAVVWDVTFLTSDVVASADSTGHVVLWSLSAGGAVQRFSAHRSHVLCLAVHGSSLFAAGVDAVVRRYDRQTASGQWFEATLFRGHTHDVRALTLTSRGLVSGGEEGRLKVFPLERDAAGVQEGRRGALSLPFLEPRYPHRVVISKQIRTPDGSSPPLLVLTYSDRLELFRLGAPACPTNFGKRQRLRAGPADDRPVPLRSPPEKLLVVAAKRDESIACSAISDAASFLAFSTCAALRVFAVEAAGTVQLTRLPMGAMPACRLLAFLPSSPKLVGVQAADGCVVVWDLSRAAALCRFVPRNAAFTSPAVHRLACGGPQGDLIALGCLDGHAYVYSAAGECLAQLPVRRKGNRSALLPMALALAPKQRRVLALYTDHKFLELELGGSVLGEGWFERFNQKAPRDWARLQHCDWLAFIDSRRVLAANHRQLMVLDTAQPVGKMLPHAVVGATPGGKRPRREEEEPCLRVSEQFCFLLHAQPISKTELAVLTITPENYALALPPALHRKRFGL